MFTRGLYGYIYVLIPNGSSCSVWPNGYTPKPTWPDA